MNNALPYNNFPDAVAAAKAARKRGDKEEAASIYRLLPQAFPEKKHAATVAADGLRDCGFWVDAVAVLDTALRSAPKSALFLSALAEMYRAIGDYPRAAGYIQRYLDHDSRDPEAWLHLARLHDLAGNHVQSEAAYASALERDPMSTIAAAGRGDSLFHLGRLEEAVACYRRAVAIAPRDPNSLFALGSALISQGAMIEGHSYLKQAIEVDPSNARAHVNLGLAYFNTGNTKDAATAARNALLADGKLQIAHVLLGLALAEEGDLEGAGTALTAATAGDSHNMEALVALAAVQVALGNKTAGELALQRVLASAPEDKEARHLIAALHSAAVTTPIEGYSREAFDRLAPRYENQEIRFRSYAVPRALADLIEEYQPERREIAHLVDVGCGTGLVAAALQDAFRVKQSIGIDVSPDMAKVAEAKSIYDQIIVDDAATALTKLDRQFDVISAGDLLPYLGDVSALLRAARARTAPGGILAYSFELSEGDPLKLSPSGRFTHSQIYIEETARSSGFRPLASRPIILRRLFGRDIPGVVGLLQA